MDNNKPFRWGIVGTGKICQDFVAAVQLNCPDAQIVAVTSRTQAAADAFGKQFNVKSCYASLEDLTKDENVDAIYVGTPHPFHKNGVEAALLKA